MYNNYEYDANVVLKHKYSSNCKASKKLLLVRARKIKVVEIIRETESLKTLFIFSWRDSRTVHTRKKKIVRWKKLKQEQFVCRMRKKSREMKGTQKQELFIHVKKKIVKWTRYT